MGIVCILVSLFIESSLAVNFMLSGESLDQLERIRDLSNRIDTIHEALGTKTQELMQTEPNIELLWLI